MQLKAATSDLTAMSARTDDEVNVESSSVSVTGMDITEESTEGTTVVYDMEFVRDVAELPQDEDWVEIIPYEVDISPAGAISAIVAQDLEYQLENDEPEFYEDPDEENSVGSQDGTPAETTMPESAITKSAAGTAKGTVTTMALGATNKQKIVDYALKWWNGKNTKYPTNYGNDCTNFVSQALHNGGWSQNDLFYTSDKAWWGRNWGPPYASYTWGGAENFYRFARVQSKRATRLSNVYSLVKGDVLQYKGKSSKVMNHTMVTTAKLNGVPYLTYHTTNTRNKPFTSLKSMNVYWFASRV